ncbi:MAG: SdpI family protein [Faecalimonas sp.]|nr:SdpI family protein [Faecalimonas sp.]
MWFWWFMLICDSLTPLIMILCGRGMWKHCPQKINSGYGYRTKMSMKNMDTWKFAHEYAGKLWWRVGWITLVLSLLVHIPIYGASEDTIGIVGAILVSVQALVLFLSIFPTENALKKTFDEEGRHRESER